jgi:hypothetical protein
MDLIQAEIDLLSDSECEQIQARVQDLQNHWIRRDPVLPFYTLAGASYLDPFWYYQKLLSIHNPILSEHFNWLHQRCCEALSNYLCEPVSCHPSLALPGFHIFFSHESFAREDAASAHWDLQFFEIQWRSEDQPDFANPISFTVPIHLPQSGGGLNLWEISQREFGSLSQQERERVRKSKTKHFFPYSNGRMVVHSGLHLHQIAPFHMEDDKEMRITFQGHALRFKDGWHVYW